MTLGEFIKDYLEEHEISQRQFADKIDVSPSYINILVRGTNNSTGKPMIPSLPIMVRIAKGMGMSVDDLFKSVDDMDIYLPPSTPTRDDYAAIGVAARIITTKDDEPRKTALDKIIDQLTQYRDAMPYGLRPDEERLLNDYRMLNTKQRVKLRKLIDLMLDDDE